MFPVTKGLVTECLLYSINFLQLYFLGCAPPIESRSKTLITICSASGLDKPGLDKPGLHKLKLQDEPEPCLIHKLRSLYSSNHPDCQFICQVINNTELV